MAVAFPGESAEYRAARNRLLDQEIELRRAHGGGGRREAAAAARRGRARGLRLSGARARRRPGPGAAVRTVRAGQELAGDLQHDVSPRGRRHQPRARPAGKPRCCPWRRDRARHAPPCSTSWTARPGTSLSTSTSRSPRRRRSSASSPSPPNAAGGGCACCPRPAAPTTATTWPRPPTAPSSRC